MADYYMSYKKPQLVSKIRELEAEIRKTAVNQYKFEQATERVAELEEKLESIKSDRSGGRAYEEGVASTLRNQVEYFQSIFRIIAIPSDKIIEIKRIEEEERNRPKSEKPFNYQPSQDFRPF